MAYFAHRNQPAKALYVVYFLASVLVVRMPVWLLRSAVPALRQKRSWSFSRALTLHVLNAVAVELPFQIGFSPAPDPYKAATTADKNGFVWVEPLPHELVVGEIGEMARVNDVTPVRCFGYWFGERDEHGKHGQRAQKGERVLYYFHGGGYFTGTGHPDSAAGSIVHAVFDACRPTLTRAFALDYRTTSSAPFPAANPFPAALLDALSGYRYLLSLGFAPSDIVVAGDSAGGHLATILIQYTVRAGLDALPTAGAALLLSPSLDWGNTHAGTEHDTMARETDYVRAVYMSGYTTRGLRGRLPLDAFATNAWLSPGSLRLESDEGLCAGFPHTLVIAGGAEQSLDAMRTWSRRLVRDIGKRATFTEYPDAFHDFILIPWHEPERSLALQQIKDWVRGIYIGQ